MTTAPCRPGTAPGRHGGATDATDVEVDAGGDGPGPGPAPTEPRTTGRFRADIEGLRAIAVLLVVLGHAGVGVVAGGYVGVDVFFVISGFLITSLLLREVRTTGRISLRRFYARRALRLLPASTVMVAATLAGAWLWLSPLRFAGFARDAAAGAAYLSNIRFAVTGTDYLTAAEPPSPFQHLWSLAVEEQFYLLWPALVLAAAWGWRRGRFTVRGTGVALTALIGASLLLSVTETQRSAPWAYFGAHTRVWELGVGALLALGAATLGRLAARPAAALSWVGLAAIGAAALAYDDATPYPGVAAILPVAGAALVLAGGCADPPGGARLLLATSPLQLIGRLSYGWYLWHWPVLLIAPAALGIAAGTGTNLLLCLGALGLAAASLVLVEDPLRGHRGLRARPARGLAVGLVLSAGAVTVALLASLAPPAIGAGADVPDTRAALARADDPARLLAGLIAAAPDHDTLPSNLTPALTAVKGDKPQPYADRCHLGFPEVVPPGPCAYGYLPSTRTVVLFGDSHAAQWFPALRELAASSGWRLLSRTKSACSAADVLTYHATLQRAYTECQAWRRHEFAEFDALAPDLIVVSSSFNTERPIGTPTDDEVPIWRAGWRRTLRALTATGADVSLLVDTPFRSTDGPTCLAAHPHRMSACADPAAATLRRPAERAAAAAEAHSAGVTLIDPLPWLCAAVCPVVVGNLLLYRDANHLTTGYSRLLAPLLLARLPRMAAP